MIKDCMKKVVAVNLHQNVQVILKIFVHENINFFNSASSTWNEKFSCNDL